MEGKEKHRNHQCSFKAVGPWWDRRRGLNIYKLVRKCYCRLKASRADNNPEGDGVEHHTDGSCQYVWEGNNLVRRCVCGEYPNVENQGQYYAPQLAYYNRMGRR